MLYGAGIIARMANEENIIPHQFGKGSASEERAKQSRGGKKSGETRRRKKAVREVIEMMAAQPLTNDKLRKSIKGITAGVDDDDIDLLTAATMGLFQAAIKGNEKAYRLIAERLDESKAVEEIPEDDLSKSLRELGESL